MKQEELLSTIKYWLEVETNIDNYTKELRELRKKKKELNILLMSVMKENNIDCFDCNNGQIAYTRNNIKKPVNKKYLNDILEKYFEGEHTEEANKICNYILENRHIQVKENIKFKKKNI